MIDRIKNDIVGGTVTVSCSSSSSWWSGSEIHTAVVFGEGGMLGGAPVRGRNRISETGDGGIFFTVSRQHCRLAADRWPLLQLPPPPPRTILIIFQVIFRPDQ